MVDTAAIPLSKRVGYRVSCGCTYPNHLVRPVNFNIFRDCLVSENFTILLEIVGAWEDVIHCRIALLTFKSVQKAFDVPAGWDPGRFGPSVPHTYITSSCIHETKSTGRVLRIVYCSHDRSPDVCVSQECGKSQLLGWKAYSRSIPPTPHTILSSLVKVLQPSIVHSRSKTSEMTR